MKLARTMMSQPPIKVIVTDLYIQISVHGSNLKGGLNFLQQVGISIENSHVSCINFGTAPFYTLLGFALKWRGFKVYKKMVRWYTR